ncbi:hypothetical protein N9L92_02690 [Saprospiraceae bacterium]|nr:hypothetical protein [Saprospiraceae bacterium]
MGIVKEITGKIVYKNFEGGFWGIESDENYYIIDLPEQLKHSDENITCVINIDEDIMSMINWGIPCVIVSFSTLHLS